MLLSCCNVEVARITPYYTVARITPPYLIVHYPYGILIVPRAHRPCPTPPDPDLQC